MSKVVGVDKKLLREITKKETGCRATCRHCASIVEYAKSEVNVYSGMDYGGGPDGREWVVCPKCGYDINLKVW